MTRVMIRIPRYPVPVPGIQGHPFMLRNSDPDWDAYLGERAFSINFSITVPVFLSFL